MRKRLILTRPGFIAILLLACLFLALNPCLSASGKSPADQFMVSIPSLAVKDAPRLVLQIIDGEMYKWIEYPGDDARQSAVLMLEPEQKMLDNIEKHQLFSASNAWKNDLILTGLPVSQPNLNALTDNRTAVDHGLSSSYPYYNIGLLAVDFSSEYIRGTAFLISPYAALTNAHNLYSTRMGGRHIRARFSPGQYETIWPESYRPFSTKDAARTEINQSFQLYESSDDRENLIRHDYAALFFNEPFTGIKTFMPLQFNLMPDKVSVIGYPGFIRGSPSQGQWLAEGTALFQNENCLFYDAFTSGGSSGSPVIVYNQAAGSYRVVAIHSFTYENQQVSGGPHLNNINIDQIESWLRWTPVEPAEAVIGITLDKTHLVLEIGAIEMLIARVSPPELSGVELLWASSNGAVATVSANGLVTAHGSGQATISVKTADGLAAAYCTVTVGRDAGSAIPVTPTFLGDLTGDGRINIEDVILAQQHVLQLRLLSESLLITADVNRDGLIDVRDVSLLMRHALGLISSF